MSEEYKEVEQTESEAEPTESGSDKETENVADKEAEQTGAEMEAVKETDQTETQEIETKDQPEVAATAAAIPSDVFVDKSVYEQIDKRKKEKRSLLLYQFLWAELFYFVILHCRSGLVSILTRIHILTDRMYPIIQ